MSIELVMPSNHLFLYHPLLLPSVFPSFRVFSSESAVCIRWPKYWSFSFSISPSNEYSGLISFKIDWFHLLGVQGTFKSLLQHHSLKASIVWHLAFFMVQLSHPQIWGFSSGSVVKNLPTVQESQETQAGPAFFMVQLSYLYMTTGKTMAFTIHNSVSKVMSLLLNNF